MMNMPEIQSFMNDPVLMRSLIMSNLQMREIIDRNSDLAHILSDPGTLRQTLDVAWNPELMRATMRDTNGAMSNIESSAKTLTCSVVCMQQFKRQSSMLRF